MRKIIIFEGSPRKNGYCAELIKQVAAGAESKGADVMICNLNADGTKGCQACNYCKTHTECICRDAMSPALEALRSADGVVAAFPIYWGGISGQSKLFLDRLYSFTIKGNPKHPGKKAVMIYTQGAGSAAYYANVRDEINDYVAQLGWELTDSILAYNTSMTQTEVPQELLDRAFAAGREIAE